jgi:hypothetical protein
MRRAAQVLASLVAGIIVTAIAIHMFYHPKTPCGATFNSDKTVTANYCSEKSSIWP